jgi:drug/metabolite transporter superfamily protein YnfA
LALSWLKNPDATIRPADMGRHLAAAGGFVILAIIWTLPLSLHLSTSPDRGLDAFVRRERV